MFGKQIITKYQLLARKRWLRGGEANINPSGKTSARQNLNKLNIIQRKVSSKWTLKSFLLTALFSCNWIIFYGKQNQCQYLDRSVNTNETLNFLKFINKTFTWTKMINECFHLTLTFYINKCLLFVSSVKSGHQRFRDCDQIFAWAVMVCAGCQRLSIFVSGCDELWSELGWPRVLFAVTNL